ncbi:MotA/TolQ/ExbB proton channel family protein [Apibacter raozihei]|uniref:MotA/TolQ/ExbB proton channel family protein n=1 Tax=Apibacter raozihei TaxID=2500547 RepID=UPI000FE2C61F|nr:MotA/TolQ/ExbB proton channel family protein [Apibacter raozihei]
MEKQQLTQSNTPARKAGGLNPFITIVILLVIGELIYHLILGNSSNFEGGTTDGKPTTFMGIIHKGGIIVPFLISFVLMVLVFSIERFFIIGKAEGTGSLTNFVNQIRSLLDKNQINEAISLCDKQKGSIGNVVKEGLISYKNLANDNTLDKEQKLASLSKTLEEATTLEMPMLEKNMTILATIASVGTLVALMGTVIGMIKAFFALGDGGGSPDAAALSVGISEALVNTALGIGASALAIITYNFFTSKIDTLTFKIDEVGLSIQQSFAAHH